MLSILATTAGEIVTKSLAPALTALSLLALIFCTLIIIIGAYYYMSSSGNPEKLARAKRLISQALIGLVIVLSAAFIAHFLKNAYGPVASPQGASVVPKLNAIKASSSSGLITVVIKVISGILSSIIETVAIPFLKALSYFTSGTPLVAANHSVFNLWISTVGMADALMVLVIMLVGFHVMGFSTLGLGEISIRQVLPQIGLVFILINSSLFIIDAIIGLSNVLIKAIGGGGNAASSVWSVLSNVVKQPSAYGLAALIIMTIFLVFSVILLIYYVGRIVTIYLGAVLAPLVILCWLLPSLRDIATSATKRYFSAVFVLFIHVVILELAASILASLLNQGSTTDSLMALMVGLATLIALLKTQGVMNQLAFVAIGPRMTRRLAQQLVYNASYFSNQAGHYLSSHLNTNQQASSTHQHHQPASSYKAQPPRPQSSKDSLANTKPSSRPKPTESKKP